MIKELGFGLAVAVLLDATIIRVVLVPATMRLLGEWNWWLPSWLARILPKVQPEKDVERPAGPSPVERIHEPAGWEAIRGPRRDAT